MMIILHKINGAIKENSSVGLGNKSEKIDNY